MATILPFTADRTPRWKRLDLAEIDAAIALVAEGWAERVRLVNLRRPRSSVAISLARAEEAGVELTYEDGEGEPFIDVGPRT